MSSNPVKLPPPSVLLLALCLLAAFLAPRAVLAQAAAPPPSPLEEYQALLAKMKKSDSTVDFSRLRSLRTQLDNYDPYGPDRDERPAKALAEGNLEAAKTLAEKTLAENDLDLEAHAIAAVLAEKRKDTAAAAYHRYAFQGILDSVLKSGDGNSPETAYKVIAVSEEYAVMKHLGLRVAMQDLVKIEGHSYDLLEGTDAEGRSRPVFFNIDPVMKALDKKFSQ